VADARQPLDEDRVVQLDVRNDLDVDFVHGVTPARGA